MTNTDYSPDDPTDQAARDLLLRQLAAKIEPVTELLRKDWQHVTQPDDSYARARH